MKVYWVCYPNKCFFRTSKKKAQEDVDYRNNEREGVLIRLRKDIPKKDWFVLCEDIPDEEMGKCINDDTPKVAWMKDCAVGTVRKMRNEVEDDDGTCKTCPYFEPPKGE